MKNWIKQKINNFLKTENFIVFERTSPFVKLPTRGTTLSSGLDFYSPIDVTIKPLCDYLIPLDLKVMLPEGTDLVFKEKSGRATKDKLIVGGAVVDRGYTGIIHAHLWNLGKKNIKIKAGEKIVQAIIRKVEFPTIVEGKVFALDERGDGGFGHTGVF